MDQPQSEAGGRQGAHSGEREEQVTVISISYSKQIELLRSKHFGMTHDSGNAEQFPLEPVLRYVYTPAGHFNRKASTFTCTVFIHMPLTRGTYKSVFISKYTDTRSLSHTLKIKSAPGYHHFRSGPGSGLCTHSSVRSLFLAHRRSTRCGLLPL